MREGVTFILAEVLLPPAPCPGDAVCRCESTLFDLQNEYTTKNQWLSYIYNTFPEYYNANIQIQELFTKPGRVAYNVNTTNGCEHYKVGQFQNRKDSLVLLTHVSMFRYLKNLLLTIQSNASFEQCRVVLVWRFCDHKCRHGVMFTRRNT